MGWEWWERAIAAGVIVVVALVAARLVDRALERRGRLAPEALTRYRVLRRSAVATIAAFGIFTALLMIPQIQAVAGGILASSAVIGLVIGFAARSTLANFVAGLLIAFNQPVRLGDDVEVAGMSGKVEEIGLSHTAIKTPAGDRLLIPNEKLASETVRNATIGSPEHRAEATVAVPVSADLGAIVELLLEEIRSSPEALPKRDAAVTVSSLEADRVLVAARAWAADQAAAERLAGDLRLRIHTRLREHGVYPT